jgi:hypothetical protein
VECIKCSNVFDQIGEGDEDMALTFTIFVYELKKMCLGVVDIDDKR